VSLVRGASGGKWCTAGFIVRSLSDNKPFVLTAGHCGRYEFWTRFASDGSPHKVGTTWPGRIRDDADGDYQIVSIDNPTGWQLRAWVYVSWSGDRGTIPGTVEDPDYYISSTGTSARNTRVCHTGAQGLTSCDEVQQVNVTAPWGLRHTALTNYCAIGGDSGGPVYSLHVARGIHIGGVEGCGPHYYQGVIAAAEALNVRVATGR
jgi:hypothetical protein